VYKLAFSTSSPALGEFCLFDCSHSNSVLSFMLISHAYYMIGFNGGKGYLLLIYFLVNIIQYFSELFYLKSIQILAE
jgi:hypothetical protein